MRTDRFAFAVVFCSVLLAVSVAGCRRRSVRGAVASGGGAGGGAVSVGGEVAHGTPREMLDQFDAAMRGAGYPMVYVFPTTGVLVAVAAGILFGVLAAVIPARQASRLEIVQALRYE